MLKTQICVTRPQCVKIIRPCVGLYMYSPVKEFYTNHNFGGTLEIVKVVVKIKFTLEPATKVQRVSRVIALLFL